MSRPYTVRPPVRKPIDFQNAAAVVFVGVTSRSIRSTRIAFASSRRRVARARPTPFRRNAGSTKKSFTTRSRPSSAEGEDTPHAVAHDLLDGPGDAFGPRLDALGGEVGRDEPFHVEAVRRIRALDEDHRPRATSRGPIRITPRRLSCQKLRNRCSL